MSELRNLDWQELKQKLVGLATSAAGRERLLALAPAGSVNEAKEICRRILDFVTFVAAGSRPRMESLDLFAPWFQRLSRSAVLKTLELRDVRHFCVEALALKVLLDENAGLEALSEYRTKIMNAEEPLSAIDQIMTPGGDIRNDASERLFQLTGEKTSLGRQIQNSLDRLVKSYQIEHLLQDRFVTTREGRWVLPIKSGMQHGFEGIVHDASQSRQTVFMEPQEIVPLNNRLREVVLEIEEEIERLLTELSTYLSSLRFAFEETRAVMLDADFFLSLAQLTALLEARPVDFAEDKIELKSLRHPTLFLQNPEIVPNSIELDQERRILLLSGPNAGGKTVLLKSIGLAAQMARCGLPICAEAGSKLPFFSEILVAVGDSQSVDANLSTFAAHLQALQKAAEMKGRGSLILIDEICGSTDPEEGAALARAFVETFSANGVFGAITSHLGALKRGWEESSAVVNGSMEFAAKSGPTYRFVPGVPGQSLAIQTAKRVGVDSAIVDKAMGLLSPAVKEYQSKIEEVDILKRDIVRVQDKLNAEAKKIAEERAKYERMVAEFEREREKLLDRELREASKKIEEMIQGAKVQDVFRRHEELQKIKKQLPEIVKPQSSSASSDRRIETAEDFAKAFPAGATVYVPLVGRDGIVQGKPNTKGEVPVLSSSMRIMVPWEDLKPPQHGRAPTKEILRKRGFAAVSPHDEDRVVDLRGLTSDDAVSQLEVQLDAASLGGEDRVKIIHGHGTDTLKRAIRTYLSRSVYVKKWQAGNRDTGGDGVTWAELK